MKPKNPKFLNEAETRPQNLSEPPRIELPTIPLTEILQKTTNFDSKSLVGEGSYGRVYYALLNGERQVAIKKLDVSSESNNEFLSQVCL